MLCVSVSVATTRCHSLNKAKQVSSDHSRCYSLGDMSPNEQGWSPPDVTRKGGPQVWCPDGKGYPTWPFPGVPYHVNDPMIHLMLPSAPPVSRQTPVKTLHSRNFVWWWKKNWWVDFFLQLTTRVKSCEPAQLTTVVDGKKQKLNGYQVILEDTVLFPEGGGQVCARWVPGDAGGHCAVSLGRGQVGAQRVPGDAGGQGAVSLGKGTGRCPEGTRGCWRTLCCFLREGDGYVLRGYQGTLEDMVLFPEGGDS